MKYLFGGLAILCLGYSLVIYNVGSGTFSFAIWLVLAGIFAVFSFLTVKERYKRIPGGVKIAAGAVIIAGCSVFVICQACILSHFFDKGEDDLDYIIVLGAQMRDSGPSVIYMARLDAAYDYLMENEDTICIISGGQGGNEAVAEGDGGRAYLISRGIAENRLIAENEAMDTVENIELSYDIIKHLEQSEQPVRIGIITNNFHLFRGLYIAGKLTDAEVCGIAAFTERLYLPNNMVRESFGIVRDCVL